MDPEEGVARTLRIDIRPGVSGADIGPTRRECDPDARDTTFVRDAVRHADQSSDYKRLLQSIYDAVLVTDMKGRIIDFNSRSVDFFRCTEDALEGTQVVGLVSGGDTSLLTEIRHNLRDHRYTLIEAHCVRRDGTIFPSEIAVNRIELSGDGQLCFFIRDISVRKRAEEALEEAVARLEQHDRARSQFVSNVSHELRTPLTSMIYAVANMRKGVAGPVSGPLMRYLSILDGDCKRLLSTVNDILDLRKIDSNGMTLEKSLIPFGALVRKSAESLRGQADRKALHLDISSEVACFVGCDVNKLERVVLNIVNNAIKFTPDGGQVQVSVTRTRDRAGEIRLRVADTGIGIPEDAVQKVTDRYFTVGDQPTGSGLGLAISKEIVELHGGRIEVESPAGEFGRGTGVSVMLPSAVSPRILVVHGQSDVAENLVENLEGWGYRASAEEPRGDILAAIRDRKPDLVILDVVPPERTDAELILRMKEDGELRRIPLVVVSGAHITGAREQLLRNFSIPVLSVPWSADLLLEQVEATLL